MVSVGGRLARFLSRGAVFSFMPARAAVCAGIADGLFSAKLRLSWSCVFVVFAVFGGFLAFLSAVVVVVVSFVVVFVVIVVVVVIPVVFLVLFVVLLGLVPVVFVPGTIVVWIVG